MQMNSLRQKTIGSLPKLVFVLFLLQPMMDVLSFWMDQWGMGNTLTLALRMAVLGATVLVGFFLTRNRRVYYIAGGVLMLLAAGHMAACMQAGYRSPFTDLSNFARVAQLPVTTICLITAMRENEDSYRAMAWGFAVNLGLILAVELLASLTGTEPHTYRDGKGFMGWFQNTNSQSCILSMLPPVAVVFLMGKKGLRSVWVWLALVGGMAAQFLLGPRLAILGLVAMGFGLALCQLLIDRKLWRRSAALAVVTVVFLGCVGQSPMVKHQAIYEDVQGERQDSVNTAVSQDKLPSLQEEELTQEELQRRKEQWEKTLAPIYEKYTPDFVELFGLEKTMKIYDYTYDVTALTATRDKKIRFSRLLMAESPSLSKWFGVELSRFTVNDKIYDVENDFHGIYFLYGGVGLAAMLAFLGYFLWLILRALCKDWKRYFTMEAAGWGIALTMGLIHAYFTAAVLRRPNASFYLSAVLAAAYYLVKIKTYPDKKE